MLSSLKTHWWQKLLVISELHRQQSILLYAKTRSCADRIYINTKNRNFCTRNNITRRSFALFGSSRRIPFSGGPM